MATIGGPVPVFVETTARETRPRPLVVVIACAVAALAGCRGCGARPGSDSPEPPALGGVVVKAPGTVMLGNAELRIDDAALASKVAARLHAADVLSPPRKDRVVLDVELAAEGMSGGSADHPELGVRMHLRVVPRPARPGYQRYAEDTGAIGQVSPQTTASEGADSPLQRLAERTAEDLVGGYLRRQKLWSASEQDLGVALASSDSELRVEAMRVIGQRKLKTLVPALLPLLQDEEEEVRDAALGALVTLRERKAVKTLADSRQMRDVREMAKVLDAIGTLGGQEAEEYLAFVAETHDDEEIRGMAKQALDRLRRTAAQNKPTK